MLLLWRECTAENQICYESMTRCHCKDRMITRGGRETRHVEMGSRNSPSTIWKRGTHSRITCRCFLSGYGEAMTSHSSTEAPKAAKYCSSERDPRGQAAMPIRDREATWRGGALRSTVEYVHTSRQILTGRPGHPGGLQDPCLLPNGLLFPGAPERSGVSGGCIHVSGFLVDLLWIGGCFVSVVRSSGRTYDTSRVPCTEKYLLTAEHSFKISHVGRPA